MARSDVVKGELEISVLVRGMRDWMRALHQATRAFEELAEAFGEEPGRMGCACHCAVVHLGQHLCKSVATTKAVRRGLEGTSYVPLCGPCAAIPEPSGEPASRAGAAA